eukprot:TRINITY_DN73321_c0_g1_i1.p1 TRINITY_DN73321_c0_g1~~TRINITY_DN73321_c0_g1_i1.p1  ORF type:complete len:441 (+),score=78.74 TRINITY_DN73321_c0_g1_i1:57-1379(+)
MMESLRALCCVRESREPEPPKEKTADADGSQEAAAQSDDRVNTLMMKEQLERVKCELFKVFDDEIHGFFDKADPAGSGSLSVECMKQVFHDMGVPPPPEMRVFDFNRNGKFEKNEFDAMMKYTLTHNLEQAVRSVLMNSVKARAWAEQSWKLGVRSKDVNPENGEVEMSVDVVVELFASVAEVNDRSHGLSEEEVREKISEFDTDGTNNLCFSEFQHLYLYFLAKLYEDIKEDNADNASEDDTEAADTTAFKEHLAMIKTEIDQVMNESIHLAFKKADPDDFGCITFEQAERVFRHYVVLNFEEADADGGGDDMCQPDEFLAVVKPAAAKNEKLRMAILRDNDRVKEWSMQGWKMCLKDGDDEEEAIVRIYTIISVLQRLCEVLEIEEFDDGEAKDMLHEFDDDGTGSIAKPEFEAFFVKLLSHMYEHMVNSPKKAKTTR